MRGAIGHEFAKFMFHLLRGELGVGFANTFCAQLDGSLNPLNGRIDHPRVAARRGKVAVAGEVAGYLPDSILGAT